MTNVCLEIGGHRYEVTCREGQEGHFLGLARVIESKVEQVSRSVGRLDATRQLLFAALLLADECGEHRARAAGGAVVDDATLDRLARLAERLEAIAEQGPSLPPPAALSPTAVGTARYEP